MKKILIPIIILITTTLAGCQTSQNKQIKQNSLENILPADSQIAIQLNYDNKTQKENIKKIINTFPKTEITDLITNKLNNEINENLTFTDNIAPFLKSDFKLIIGAKLNNKNIENDTEIYIAGKFKEKTLLNKILSKIEQKENCKKETLKTSTFWTCEKENIYIAQQNDIFLITNQNKNRSAALERLENNTGFKNSAYFTKLDTSNVIAQYVITKKFFDIMPSTFKNTSFGDIYGTIKAKEKQIISESISTATGYMKPLKTTYNFEIASKVPAQGLIAYTEQAVLGEHLKNFWEGFRTGFNLESNEKLLPNYDEIITNIATELNIDTESLKNFIKEPFAFSMTNTNNYFPSFAFFIKTTKETSKTASIIKLKLDELADIMIAEYEKEMLTENFGQNLITKEQTIINGGQISEIHLNLQTLPKEFTNEAITMTGIDIKDLKIELYYGLTGDNIFTIAFQPNFASNYGKNTVSEQEYFKKLQTKSTNDFPLSISYFNISQLFKITDTYTNLYSRIGILKEKEIEIYNKIKASLNTIDYFITKSEYKNETLNSKSSIYIK